MAFQSVARLEDAPAPKAFGVVICFSSSRMVRRFLLRREDLTDVGVSDALHTGFGFFGLLNAVSASRPCGWGGHEQRGPEQQRFHVLHSIRDGFRSALYTGSPVSARRVTLDDPDSTACLFGPSLKQPRMAGFSLTMLASI